MAEKSVRDRARARAQAEAEDIQVEETTEFVTAPMKPAPEREGPSTLFSEWPFPTDRWGMMSLVKRYLQNAMSRANGIPEKNDTVEKTLEALLEWVRARRIETEAMHKRRVEG